MNGQRNLSKLGTGAPPALTQPAQKETKQATQPAESPQKLMEEIIKKEQYDGCSLLTSRRNTWWYVCSKKENEHKPTFYNYNKFRKEPHSKVMKIVSFSSKKMTFENGNTEDLKLSPFYWMGKFGGGTISPETECNFKEIGTGNPTTYTLSCKGQDVQEKIQLEKIKSSS